MSTCKLTVNKICYKERKDECNIVNALFSTHPSASMSSLLLMPNLTRFPSRSISERGKLFTRPSTSLLLSSLIDRSGGAATNQGPADGPARLRVRPRLPPQVKQGGRTLPLGRRRRRRRTWARSQLQQGKEGLRAKKTQPRIIASPERAARGAPSLPSFLLHTAGKEGL